MAEELRPSAKAAADVAQALDPAGSTAAAQLGQEPHAEQQQPVQAPPPQQAQQEQVLPPPQAMQPPLPLMPAEQALNVPLQPQQLAPALAPQQAPQQAPQPPSTSPLLQQPSVQVVWEPPADGGGALPTTVDLAQEAINFLEAQVVSAINQSTDQ